jgi:hypothetical protein
MSRSPLPRGRTRAALALATLLGSLPAPSCGNPGEGTIQTAPSARHHTADPVPKVRAAVRSSEAENSTPIPGEPGKLGPARGRTGD